MPDSSSDPTRTVAQIPEPDTGSTVAAPPTDGALAPTRGEHDTPTRVFQAPGLPLVPGYVVAREVARGGMGTVYVAHDPTFEREVAIKVMHLGQDGDRFVIESKVTAQLPHPGIPPVYALGELPDGRPFLAMKLIGGRTLADELKAAERTDLPRLIGAFEHICQTVGFAHARGIIHRDLKPANVMVGSFGEVLVMDWGLAREVRSMEPPSAPRAARRAPHSDETQAGQVKGTPAYMAPEQARGEPVDARADVFALGGILAAVLTGKAPFDGTTVVEAVRRAATADLGACFARLDACGADAELVAIAKRCLAAEAGNRYANGEGAARAVADYRAGVEKRLRTAERERAAAEAKAAEEVNTRREAEARADAERAKTNEQRKRRRVQLVLAAAVVLLVGGAGAFAWWRDKQAGERELADERALSEQQRVEAERAATQQRLDAEQDFKSRQARQGVEANLALAGELRKQYKFKAAEAALAQAVESAKGAPELLPPVEQARRDLALVVALDTVRYRKWAFTPSVHGRGTFNTKIAPAEYRKAFASHGLDVAALDPAEAVQRVAGSAVKADLVAALDDWALYERDAAVRDRLLAIARRADPGPWSDRLRDPGIWKDRAAVEKLAADADLAHTPPAALGALAALMARRNLDPSPLLSAARGKYPTDFELAFNLGWWHADSNDGRQIGPYEAARALRPENGTVWTNLGVALHGRRDVEGALAAYREAIRLDPNYAPSHNNLGTVLFSRGDLSGAEAAHREAIRLDPDYAKAHYNLGVVLAARGKPNAALAAYQEAVRVDPELAPAHTNLGAALNAKGDRDGAIAAHQEAIRLDPTFGRAYSNLGVALKEKGDLEGAIAAHLEAVKYEPTQPLVHTNLGAVYFQQKRYADAIACARAAIAADPKYSNAHAMLGSALQQTGDIPGARAALTEAARLDKKWAPMLGRLPPLTVAPPPREVPRP